MAAAIAASGATAAAMAAGGDAKTSGGRVMKLYENDKAQASHYVDLPPQSPIANLRSPKFKVSVGDEVIFRTPLVTARGGKTGAGTLDGEATILSGTTFANARLRLVGTIVRKEGTIEIAGTYPPSKTRTVAVTGGTGAFARARGTVTNANGLNTVILRP
jgi:hypothetical protein